MKLFIIVSMYFSFDFFKEEKVKQKKIFFLNFFITENKNNLNFVINKFYKILFNLLNSVFQREKLFQKVYIFN